jgi:hypothetical protein
MQITIRMVRLKIPGTGGCERILSEKLLNKEKVLNFLLNRPRELYSRLVGLIYPVEID